MNTDTNSDFAPFNNQTPIPLSITCVKSFARIDLLPALCKEPSILIPIALVPIDEQFCTKGDLATI